MKFIRKGGVWKNTEDEILKVAVMKYGKNQWARISSLLVRKSPAQCKARWYEYLDPSLKKTDWTREEEEKLLYLAKAMPCQWRTIAPLVGRTATQCIEHYSKLLDAVTGGNDETMELRKPKTGDVDPYIETKPAMPDSVDMDEDEKEMLQEARARLANTKGKKAKRKAREKQLQEARRLAVLQKKREMKAAGIEQKSTQQAISQQKKKKRREEINYNEEIPFERVAPKGFFDTSQEDLIAKKQKVTDSNFKPISLKDLEEERRDVAEARERKKDAMKQKVLKQHDLPEYVKRIARINEKSSSKIRPQLILPNPQISADEFEDVMKLNAAAALASQISGGLLIDQNSLVSGFVTPTPMRTPQRSQVGDDLLLKAKNLAVLQNAQTPLIGGVNEQLASVSATVNSLATPNPLATPLLSVGTSISESEKLKNARKKLKLSFANIPAPKNEYELLPPEIPSESEKDQIMKPTIEMDAEELAQLNAMKKANEEQVFRSLQSSIVQRGNLPIPSFSVSTIDPLSFGDSSVSQDVVNANEMINDECTRLMIYDIYHQGSVETPEEWDEILKEFRIDEFSRSELDQAKVLILSEASASTDSTITVKEMYQYLVSRDPVITTLPDLDLLTGLQKINSKMYNKIRIKHGGYIARADALQSESFQLESELESLQIDLKCFKELLSNEAAVIEYRLKEWSMLSSKMSNKEHFFS